MKEKATIEEVHTSADTGSIPTLLKFQHGQLSVITKDTTQFSRLLRKNNKESKRKVAIVTARDQIYHGLIDDSDAATLTDTYICVRNKISNKVQIIPIEQATLKNHLFSTPTDEPKNALSVEQNNALLMKKFGTRKAARIATNIENMKMNIDVLKSDLDNTVNETNLTNEVEEKVDSEQNFNNLRPIFNKDATKLDEVYNILDIVPIELLKRLNEESKVVYATPLEKLPIESEFLCNYVKHIQNKALTSEGSLHLKLVIYMDSLLKLCKTNSRITKFTELSKISEKIENDIRKRFCDPHAHLFTQHSSEKALCYFIVLALLISDEFTVDSNALSETLGVPKKKLLKFAHIVNARPMPKSSMLTLCLPSKIHPLAWGYRRKQ